MVVVELGVLFGNDGGGGGGIVITGGAGGLASIGFTGLVFGVVG